MPACASSTARPPISTEPRRHSSGSPPTAIAREQWSAAFARTSRPTSQERTSLDLNELIQEALALGGGDLQKHRIVVQAEPNRQLPAVSGNRVQLQQVLLNLIMNAIDAMAAKGRAEDPERQVASRTKATASWYRWRTPGPESARRTSSGYSTRSSRPSPTAWGWACRSAARSSRRTKAGCGLPRTRPRGAVFQFTLPTDRTGVRRSLILFADAGSGSSVSRASPPSAPARRAIRHPSSS